MSEEQLTRKERRAQKRAEKQERKELESQNEKQGAFTQNILAWGLVAILGAGMVLFVGNLISGENRPAARLEAGDVVELNVSEDDWIRGNVEAPVTVVEYGDFQCPACRQAAPVLETLLEEYEGDVRLVFRHFPLLMHQSAPEAARAAEAAGEQGAFFEMHDILFENQDEWARASNVQEIFVGYAEELGLDTEAFVAAYESEEVRARVEEDRESGNELGVAGTPTIFVNGEYVSAPSYAALSERIEGILSADEGAGEAQTEENSATDTETEEAPAN